MIPMRAKEPLNPLVVAKTKATAELKQAKDEWSCVDREFYSVLMRRRATQEKIAAAEKVLRKIEKKLASTFMVDHETQT
jgi:hypothetical protein